MKFKILTKTQADNNFKSSWLQGYINISYQELITKLGDPTYTIKDSGDYKCQYQWIVVIDKVQSTIYDWKNYDIDITKGIIDFHIGGDCKQAFDNIKALFPNHKTNFGYQ